jgi:hypothetical protein
MEANLPLNKTQTFMIIFHPTNDKVYAPTSWESLLPWLPYFVPLEVDHQYVFNVWGVFSSNRFF